jgi:hypothetical protein
LFICFLVSFDVAVGGDPADGEGAAAFEKLELFCFLVKELEQVLT